MLTDKEFTDYAIIRLTKLQNDTITKEDKENIVNDISNGYAYINGDRIEFSEREMLEKGIAMNIPIKFMDLSNTLQNVDIDDQMRPQYIYSNHDSSVNITLNALFSDANEDFVEPIRNEIMLRFEEEPGEGLGNGVVKTKQERNIYYFESMTHKKSELIYNLIFFFEIKGYIIMGSINCKEYRLDDWKDVFMQMMTSIKILIS